MMSEKLTFTYKGLSDRIQTPPVGAAPMVVPALQSFDLFTTRIWQSHLPTLFPHLERWVKAVLAMRAASPVPAGRTTRRGWNSVDMAVLEHPEFAALRLAIRAACAGALGEMGQGRVAFDLQSWINLHDR